MLVSLRDWSVHVVLRQWKICMRSEGMTFEARNRWMEETVDAV
jgi:hypothetical protein